MKAIFFLVVTSLPLFALYNGNPAEPSMPETGLWISNDDWWGVKVGYLWDQTFEKRIKVRERISSVRERFDTYFSTKNEGILTFNVSDRVEIYGRLGAMKLKLSQRPTDFVKLDYQTDSQFLWGVGGRVILVYWNEMVMGVNALYTDSHMKISKLMENGNPRKTSGACFNYSEWQVGISLSREIGMLNPYIGLAYSSLNACLNHLPEDSRFSTRIADENLEAREPFVILLGLGLTKQRNVCLNLESRLLGERGISLSGQLRF